MNAMPQKFGQMLSEGGFSTLLETFNNARSIGTEDVLAACLPLLRQVADVHESGRVAPLANPDALALADGCLCFKTDRALDVRVNPAVASRKRKTNEALQIVEEVDLVVEESDDVLLRGSRYVANDRTVSEEQSGRPCYLTGHRLWEIENGHHDPLTDIFALGLILASLATGLNFNDRTQLEAFTLAHRDLQRLNGRLHPVLVRAIERMTALERFDRAQDLRSLCDALENYRRIGSDFDRTLDAEPLGREDRETAIIKRLRARLYDTSRRNRLLYHRPVAGELNLTEASVPLVINPDLIKAGDLFTGTSEAMEKLVSGKALVVGDWIRFEEMLFVPTVLSRLRLDAMRVEQDLGASPLRLIPAMLHWYDLKNAPDVPIASPLLLLRARLTKRKGVRDAFVLEVETSKADLNPALAFVLNQLYGIVLPEKVDLSRRDALKDLFETLKRQIVVSEPGVSFAFADKPKRRLLYATVRRRIDQFQRRQTGNKGELDSKISEYSYDVKNYKPLGVQLFRQRVRVPEAPFRNIAGRPLPRYFNMANAGGETRTEMSGVFVQEVAASEGRFDWSFDTCSVVLGNFDYQKMSLLRDYDLLIQKEDLLGTQVSRLFDQKPREGLPQIDASPEELQNILPSDPSQDRAIAAAQSGESLVLQGPPGTGKSQTIANLISNFAHRGKRVLFVCQKRAALDVVRNRLAGAGLGDLTAAFHDAKSGRAGFVQELSKLYTAWSDTPPANTLDRLTRDRANILNRLGKARGTVEALVLAMDETVDGVPLHRLVEQALAQGIEAGAQMAGRDDLPGYSDWTIWRDAMKHALPVLRRATGGKGLGDTIEGTLSRKVWQDETLSTELGKHLETLDAVLESLKAGTPELYYEGFATETQTISLNLEQIRDLARYARTLGELAGDTAVDIATGDPEAGRRFEDDARALEDVSARQRKCVRLASCWTLPFDLAEAQAALLTVEKEEVRFLGTLLSSKLRSIKRLVEARTDVSALAVPPTVTQLLTWLIEHLKATEALNEEAAAFERRYGARDPVSARQRIEAVSESARALPAGLKPIAAAFARNPAPVSRQKLAEMVRQLEQATDIVLALFGDLSSVRGLRELHDRIKQLRATSSRFAVLESILRPFASAPDSIWSLLSRAETDLEEVGRRILQANLDKRFDAHPELDGIDQHLLSVVRAQYDAARSELQKVNAEILTTKIRNTFRNDLVLSNRSAGGLTPDEKARREQVLAARRLLENEFSKSRAFRSVRELVQDDSGHVISTIKPIWMMSPSSVADIIPLQNDAFDVVIFDEASQISVEEALPACVRAKQIVVVGDTKQLPPTRFFDSTARDDDTDDDDHDFELDQESLLALADEKMPNVMLRWHYRSRHETLIAFSNSAFYDNHLLSIPSPSRAVRSSDIVVPDDVNHSPDAETVFGRALGFHHLPHGVYSARSNAAESAYVARLLRSILMRRTGRTIGVVAFLEAQQRQIEESITRLAEEDEAFAQHLAEEQERTEGGEFIGLFVKNLENVQGDERDIMIVSVCYGPAASGKMRMNFGSINKLGGEKRLNVIFSRARHHMAIVSSITGDEISNDYNTGAHALKSMLQFARASSAGRAADAQRVLDRYRSGATVCARRTEECAAVTILADWLRRGAKTECDLDVGLSDFVIDIVPRCPAENTPSGRPLAILIDRNALYESGSAREILINRATALESVG